MYTDTKNSRVTCRLYPVAPNNSRILGEDVVLSGYNVPAGVSRLMVQWLNMR